MCIPAGAAPPTECTHQTTRLASRPPRRHEIRPVRLFFSRARTPSLAAIGANRCLQPLEWDEDVVTVQGSPAFLHTLRLNPSLASAFDETFGGLDGLFRDVFFELLRPKRELLDEAAAFVHSLGIQPARAAALVGLHIRNGRDFRTRKLTPEEWRKLAVCAKALVPSDGSAYGPPQAAYVVATESAESQTAATSALGTGAVVYKPSLPKGGDGGSSSREGAKRAMVGLRSSRTRVPRAQPCPLPPSRHAAAADGVWTMAFERWRVCAAGRATHRELEQRLGAHSDVVLFRDGCGAHRPARPLLPLRHFAQVPLRERHRGAPAGLARMPKLHGPSCAALETPRPRTALAAAGLPTATSHAVTGGPAGLFASAAAQVFPGCFVPWTAEMPGSMNLHSLLEKLKCAGSVRRANAHSRWIHPTGLRFLDGTTALPEKLAKKVTAF